MRQYNETLFMDTLVRFPFPRKRPPHTRPAFTPSHSPLSVVYTETCKEVRGVQKKGTQLNICACTSLLRTRTCLAVVAAIRCSREMKVLAMTDYECTEGNE